MSDAQLVQLPLGAGIDETAEDSLVAAPACRLAQNVVFPDDTSAAKRFGLASVKSLGSVMPYAKRLVSRGSEVLVTDGNQLASINPNLAGVVDRGQVSPCTLSRKLFASGNNTAAVPVASLAAVFPIVPMASVATDPTTKLRVEVANDGYNLLVAVYDEAAGAYVLPLAPLGVGAPAANISVSSGVTGGAYQPRVVIVSSVAFLFFHMPGVLGIQAYSLELTNLGMGWVVASAGLGSILLYDTGLFDVCSVQGASTIAIVAWETSTEVVSLNTFTVAGNAITTANRVAVQSLGSMTSPGVDCVSVQAATATDGIVVAWGFHNTPSAGTVFYSLNWASYNASSLAAIQTDTAMVDSSYTTGIPLPQGGLEFNAVTIARATGTGTGNTASWIVSATRHYRLAQAPYAGGSQGEAVLDTGQLVWFTATTLGAGPATPFPSVLSVVGLSKIGQYTVAGTVCFYQLLATLTGANPQIGAQYRAVLSNEAVPLSTQSLVLVQLNPSGSNNLPTVAAQAAMLSAGDVVPSTFDVAASSDGSGLVFVGTEQDNAGSTNVSTLRANYTDTQLWQYVELGNWTWLAGGCPMQYDGSSLVEVGFVQIPQTPTVALAASGSPILPQIAMTGDAGGMQYMVVWAWQDNSGNVHRSSPSLASSVDTSAGYPSAQVVAQVPQLTYRMNVRCEIYRNTAATPTIFQLITSIATSPTSTTVTFVDELGDPQIASQEEIYTQGGSLPGTAPPNLIALCVHEDRIIGVDEDGQTPWFSTTLTPAESPRFTVSFTLTPWPKAPVVAQWSLEQRLHGATAQDIMYTTGYGPADNGVGSDWVEPEIWQSGLGVASARSALVYVDGALLVTNQGLFLEDRSFSFAWASQCRRTLAANPTVVNMAAVASDASVRIALANAAGSSNVIVYFDHRRKKWSTHLAPNGSTLPYLDAISAGGTFYALMPYAGSVMYVMQEQSALAAPSWLDTVPSVGSTWVTSTIQTGWAAVAGDQGSTRVHRVMFRGLSNTPHGVTLVTARDRGANDSDVGTWTDTDIAAMTLEQMRHTPVQQKCQEMSVTLTDTAPATLGVGTGQGPSIQSLLLRSRTRRGEWKRTTVAQQR